MDSRGIFDLVNRVRVQDGFDEVPLPDWSAFLIWLGFWCRMQNFPGKRIVVYAVLPNRELAAGFAGLGCLLAGANVYADTLSWPRFRAMQTGEVVYWKQPPNGIPFMGTILGFDLIEGVEFIKVRVTKPSAAANQGVIQSVSASRFETYLFSEQPPPTRTRATSLSKAEEVISALTGSQKQRWIWADSSDGIIVTSMRKFEETASEIDIVVEGTSPLPLIELLSIGKSGQKIHSKLRFTHPRGDIAEALPLVILDGPDAYAVHEHVPVNSNLLIVLDRSEYQEGIHDSVLQLASISEDTASVALAREAPETFPPGIELLSYLVDI